MSDEGLRIATEIASAITEEILRDLMGRHLLDGVPPEILDKDIAPKWRQLVYEMLTKYGVD